MVVVGVVVWLLDGQFEIRSIHAQGLQSRSRVDFLLRIAGCAAPELHIRVADGPAAGFQIDVTAFAVEHDVVGLVGLHAGTLGGLFYRHVEILERSAGRLFFGNGQVCTQEQHDS
ncbi:hypothetical protein D3C78_1421980 [compost metagenome]